MKVTASPSWARHHAHCRWAGHTLLVLRPGRGHNAAPSCHEGRVPTLSCRSNGSGHSCHRRSFHSSHDQGLP